MSSPTFPTVVPFTDPNYLETVYQALFALLQSATFAAGVTLNKSTRAMEAPQQVAAEDQPALILINGPIDVSQGQNQTGAFSLSKVQPTAVAVIYMRADGAAPFDQDPNNTPATVANRLIWGLYNTFNTAPPYQKQELGGIVYHAWIEGAILPEIWNQQVVITIPIRILAGPYG